MVNSNPALPLNLNVNAVQSVAANYGIMAPPLGVA